MKKKPPSRPRSAPNRTRPKRLTRITHPKPNPLKTSEKSGAQRLNRIIASAGLTSRRKADEWIKSGRVRVNDQAVMELGTRAVWGVDSITVDGSEIPGPPEKIYVMLNKPFGYICSLRDPQGRHLVTELVNDIPARLYPVGRLDFDTLGLLLLTNDGDWAHRLTHPKYRISRTYKVTLAGEIKDEELRLLERGIQLDDSILCRASVAVVGRNRDRSIIRMTITQGKSRQVRRMVDAVGHEVIHLMRTHFGSLAIGDLGVGEYRFLDLEEIDSMKKLVGMH